MASLLNLGNSPLASLFNSRVTGLGNIGLIAVDLIHNKDIHISVLDS